MHPCQQCGKMIESGLPFCVFCGASQAQQSTSAVCSNCATSAAAGLKFCTGCGRPTQGSRQVIVENRPDAEISQSVNSFEVKRVPRKRSVLKWSAIIASVTLVCVLAYVNREALLGLTDKFNPFDRNKLSTAVVEDWTFEGDKDPDLEGVWPEPDWTGTKAQSVTAGDKLSIHVAENALDKERSLTLEPLDEKALLELAANPPIEGAGIFDAYHFDAGLESSQKIPGDFEITYDLSKTEFDPEMYGDIRVIRIGEDGADIQLLNSRIEGTMLKAETNRNSVIAFTALGIVIVGARTWEKYNIIKDTFGSDPYLYYSDPDMKRYTFNWPQKLGFSNPDAIRDLWLQEVAVYKKYKMVPQDYDPTAEIDAALKDGKSYSPSGAAMVYLCKIPNVNLPVMIAMVTRTPEYKKARSVITEDWIKTNVIPKQVAYAMKCAANADHYLYTVRKFAPPSSVEVYISEKVSDLGSSDNPEMFSPYMVMPILSLERVVKPDEAANKPFLENYLVTFTHELFHVTQSARYVLVRDFDSYTWFWEATATLLENEAAAYYKKTDPKLVSDGFQPEVHSYYESYARPLGLYGYWGKAADEEGAYIGQGYMMGYFLMYLKDHYVVPRGGAADDFLLRLMNAFYLSPKSPLYIIVAQSTNSWERFEMELNSYYLITGKAIVSKVALSSKDVANVFHEWISEKEFELSEAAPVVTLMPVKNPTASPVRQLVFKLDQAKYDKLQDVTLVVKRGVDDLQNNQDLALQIFSTAYTPYPFNNKLAQAFKDFGNQPYAFIQEMHLYPDGWLNGFDEPYEAIMMLKPDAPKLTIKGSDLTIELPPQSPLWQKGHVKKYLVTILDPLGNTVLIETDEKKLELKLGPSGGFTDMDDPEMRKMMGEALSKYLMANPEEKAKMEAQYGAETVQKAIDGVQGMNMDIGVMNRAAEVLQQAISGQTGEKEIAVSVQEMMEGDYPIYGPVGEVAKEKIEFQNTGKLDIAGVWQGKVQFTGESVTLEISSGKYGFDYTIVNSMYAADNMIFYGMDNGDGTVAIYTAMVGQEVKPDGEPFTTLIKNSEKELYMVAPPITLKKK